MRKISAALKGSTISGRLLLCFVASTLIPTVLVVVLLCHQFGMSFQKTAHEQMQVSQGLIKDNVDSYVTTLNTITSAPYYHSYFSSREYLDQNDEDYLLKIHEFHKEMSNLLKLTTYTQDDIADLLIWSEDKYLFRDTLFHEFWDTYDAQTITEQNWYLHALEGNGVNVFTPTYPVGDPDAVIDTSSFFLTRKIRNLKQPDQINMVIMNLNSREFDTLFDQMELSYDSFVVITNEKGELIYSSQGITPNILAEVISGDNFRFHGARWLSTASKSDYYPLKIHVVYSLDDMYRHIQKMLLTAAGIYLLGLLCAYLLYHWLSRWIRHSAATLQGTFSRLENGDLSVHCPPVGVAEFNLVGDSVNKMIDELNAYIKREYIMTIQYKNVQLYALQSQIQPHFLINTLYCFIALNQMGQKDQLNSGFYSLAHLMQYVLSKERFTTVEKELRFLEDYLKLNQFRFMSRLSYSIDCSEEYRKITIPRLLLQPLVENAIIHGIEPCEHPCHCRLEVRREGDWLCLTVEDNGIGFDPEEIEKRSAQAAQRALDPTVAKPEGRSSVGLYYVKERMKMWSERSTFSIRCQDVTRAEIKIPWEVIDNESSDC